jgi:hypothetical protein
VIFAAGVIFGIIIHKCKVFPYEIIKIAYNRIHGPSWSIGIYEGSTPFDLAAPKDISNPVLTGKDVVGVNADFVADPFMVVKDGKYFMFFEVLNRVTAQGDIAYAESTDGRKWDYRRVVIDEKFHLSYPYVFEWKGTYYLVPESNKDLSVRLYKAVRFPEEWEYVGNLLSGYRYVDPSLFHYKNEWWMFVSTVDGGVLNLYYSKSLLSGWRPHPMNPIVKLDKRFSRSGGRVIVYNDKLYRLTQDDDSSYGIRVFAFEITELSEKSYAEKLASKRPVITKTGIGWNAAGMHHADLHKIKNGWIAVVDGRNK